MTTKQTSEAALLIAGMVSTSRPFAELHPSAAVPIAAQIMDAIAAGKIPGISLKTYDGTTCWQCEKCGKTRTGRGCMTCLENAESHLRAQLAEAEKGKEKERATLNALIDEAQDGWRNCLNDRDALRGQLAEAERECEWMNEEASEDGHSWGTECGHVFYLEDGDPESNSMKFCPFCGGSLRRVFHKDQEADQ